MPDAGRKVSRVILFPGAEDHWAGITDPRERRKIQNRLAQRAYRVRNSRKGNLRIKFFRPPAVNENPGEAPTTKRVFYGPLQSEAGSCKTTTTDVNRASKVVPAEGEPFTLSEFGSLELLIADEEPEIYFQWPLVVQVYVDGVPTDHKFINLLYYNVFRAFQVNIDTLGLSAYLISLDILSPFNEVPLGGTVLEDFEDTVLTVPKLDLVSSLPPALKPTALQISILHHPWIDLFPCPKLRDNLLRVGDALDSFAICRAVCEGDEGGASGLIVWGDPWDTSGWEVTETFVQKWAWMLEGCDELIEGTNYWRALRGLEKLSLDPVV